MKITKVTCDQCNKDITMSTNCEDWRIILASEAIPAKGDIVTLLHIYKPIETKHFCGVECLKTWVGINL